MNPLGETPSLSAITFDRGIGCGVGEDGRVAVALEKPLHCVPNVSLLLESAVQPVGGPRTVSRSDRRAVSGATFPCVARGRTYRKGGLRESSEAQRAATSAATPRSSLERYGFCHGRAQDDNLVALRSGRHVTDTSTPRTPVPRPTQAPTSRTPGTARPARGRRGRGSWEGKWGRRRRRCPFRDVFLSTAWPVSSGVTVVVFDRARGPSRAAA